MSWLWVPDAPYDCENVTSLPAAVFWKAGMSCEYAALGVEYATSARFVPLVAATAAPARVPPTKRITPACLMRCIHLSYLSILSTDLVDIADGEATRQGGIGLTYLLRVFGFRRCCFENFRHFWRSSDCARPSRLRSSRASSRWSLR